MHRKANINCGARRVGSLALLGMATSLGIAGLLASGDASALATPSIQINIPTNFKQEKNLTPGLTAKDYSSYYVPVGVMMTGIDEAAIHVSSTSDDTALTGQAKGKKINALSSPVSFGVFTSQSDEHVNEWGYRSALTPITDRNLALHPENINDNTDLNATTKWIDVKTGALNSANLGPMATKTANPTVASIPPEATNKGEYNGIFTLEFATKVDGNLNSDTYNGQVAVSVVATPFKATMFDLTYMHEMTSDICINTTTPSNTATEATHEHTSDKTKVPETTLTDIRDGKTYLVRKLADGQCWMAQNLALDFKEEDGTFAEHNEAGAISSQGGTGDSSDATMEYTGILANSKIVFSAANTDLNSGIEYWTPAYAEATYKGMNGGNLVGIKTYATITSTVQGDDFNYAWKNDGSDGLRSYSYVASNPAWEYSKEGNNAYDNRGNLYNWTAATLGSGVEISSGEAQNSICPKGWQLPVNGDSNDTPKSFRNLLRKTYGLTAAGGGEAGAADLVKIQEFPLNFTRSGYYSRALGGVRNMTTNGYWWSSTVGSATDARYLYTLTGYVNAENLNLRGYGFSVRCVAR